jgi:taurine dioxygenase
MITFTRLSGALGADVHGIDLTQPLTTGTADVIHTGLLDHQVLFCREQQILAFEQHLAMVKHFGEPEPTPFRRPGNDTSTTL